jgi:hypothetical protein
MSTIEFKWSANIIQVKTKWKSTMVTYQFHDPELQLMNDKKS